GLRGRGLSFRVAARAFRATRWRAGATYRVLGQRVDEERTPRHAASNELVAPAVQRLCAGRLRVRLSAAGSGRRGRYRTRAMIAPTRALTATPMSSSRAPRRGRRRSAMSASNSAAVPLAFMTAWVGGVGTTAGGAGALDACGGGPLEGPVAVASDAASGRT